MSNDSLGDRIKAYEDAQRDYLPNRMPTIIRLDGKAWHSYTRELKRPIDTNLVNALNETAIHLCEEIQGTKIAYLQSDEISILLYSPKFETQTWFNGNIQKMVSVAASTASAYFTSISDRVFGKINPTCFDARVFVVPLDEVVNSFEWRQQDATRNSIQSLARSMFSYKECNNKDCSELQEICFRKGTNWNDLPTHQKRGRCVIKQRYEKDGAIRNKWVIDNEIPIFHKDRNYIEQYLTPPTIEE